jgi:acyl-coenzyme A synthetase/AMP-(fatty) acid ligase
MSINSTFSVKEPVWIKPMDLPIDFGGPVDVPFTPLPESARDNSFISLEWLVESFGDRVAVTDGVTSLTYSQFADRVYGLAAEIASKVEPGGVVASVIHNTPLAAVVMLATVAAGRVLIPIDAGHPIERQAALFAETGAGAVVVAKDVEIDDSFIPASTPRIAVDISKPSGAPPMRRNFDPDQPIMVMFTSGSTGRPKGLAYGQAGDSNAMSRMVARWHLSSNDVVCNLASLTQGGAGDIATALVAGGTLRIIDMKKIGIVESLRVMADEGVTILRFVPSVLRTLMAMPGVEKSFAKLRMLDLIGERILASDIELFRAKLPADCVIGITYGSTEAGAVFHWFVDDAKIEGPVAPIGYLISDKQVCLIDENGGPTPAGEVGELIVRGPMAMGSWQGGKLSSNRFVIDPENPKWKIYPMGDQVRLRPDGLFEFVGRRDRQVKIRGLWADLGEVESALRAAEGVAEAVVIAHSSAGQSDILVAFITVDDPAAPPSSSDLRRMIASGTAEHMVPAQIRVLPEIPRLANYKPDLVRLDRLV